VSPLYRSVLITGATGAIGGALAEACAGPGVRLELLGRCRERLEGVAERCRARGAEVGIHLLDLRDRVALQAWMSQFVEDRLPDLVIANAGINVHGNGSGEPEPWAQAEALLEVNVRSTLALAHHFGEQMRRRRRGQLVLISSLAAWYGLPVTPSYSASKAAVKAYGEGMRGRLAPFGVGVTVVMPGYVKSPMCSAMPGPKPLLWEPERAARAIMQGVRRNRARITFPFPLNWGCWWLAVLPAALSQRLLRWLDYTP